MIYGKESIPDGWIDKLQNKRLIDLICRRFTKSLFGITEAKTVIDRFDGEYGFLAMKAPAEIIVDGYVYSNVASAFYALGVPEEYRGQFSWTNARQARKLYKELPHFTEEFALENRLYRAAKAKFEQNKKLKEKLLQTGELNIIYDTTGSHDNVLGRCQCKDCQKNEYQNLYGKILMRVREELR